MTARRWPIPGGLYRAELAPPGPPPGAVPALSAPTGAPPPARRFTFVARAGEAPDDNGVAIRLAGLDLGRYRRNPVLLLGHSPALPIGTADVALRAGRLLAAVEVVAEASAVAAEAARLVAAGVLRGASVGVRLLRSREVDGGRVLEVLRGELVELSLTTQPADPAALRVA